MPITKEQLENMSVEEFHSTAEKLGISDSRSRDKIDVIYDIIEKSVNESVANAAPKAAAKKRTRISVKNVDRVYTANQKGAKKVDKTMTVMKDDSLFADLPIEERKKLTEQEEALRKAEEESKTAVEEPVVAEASTLPSLFGSEMVPQSETPKRRGRKPGSKNKKTLEREAAESARKAEKQGENVAEPATTDSRPTENDVIPEMMFNQTGGELPKETIIKSSTLSLADEKSDFIILQDIPSANTIDDFVEPNLFVGSGNSAKTPSSAFNPITQAQVREKEKDAKEYFDFSNLIEVSGVLEVIDNNYGYLRSADYNYLTSPDDIYVSQQQIKQYGLNTGDVIDCTIRPPKDNEKFFPMMNVLRINGYDPSVVRDRIPFEYLTPLFPDEKFKLCKGKADSMSARVVDLFAPIGKGQRALIVAQPKTGKTWLMKDIANAIAANHPEAYIIMLLIDERPEEVTDMARTVNAEVIASTFDAPAENHVKIAGLVLEKAKRMVECGQDVVIFLDSITRLARAYNTVSPASGKVLTGGVDANALQKPKRFFGAARNIEGGGSLTIIATALIDTGSKMDEVIFEEFKGTGNMELQLDRNLSNKRIYPSVNILASSTRRDDLLQEYSTLSRINILRNHIGDMTPQEAMEFMKERLDRTINNEEFLMSMNG